MLKIFLFLNLFSCSLIAKGLPFIDYGLKGGLILENSKSGLSFFGDHNKWKLQYNLKEGEYYLFCNSDKSLVLKSNPAFGGISGEVMSVTVKKSKNEDCQKALILKNINNFESQQGIKLGLSRKAVLNTWPIPQNATNIINRKDLLKFSVPGAAIKKLLVTYKVEFKSDKVASFSIIQMIP